MKGSIVKRPSGAYGLIIPLGYEVNPETGQRRQKQKWVTFWPDPALTEREAKKAAAKKLIALMNAHHQGEWLETSKITLGEWLATWLKETVKPTLAMNTYAQYEGACRVHFTPALGAIALQALRPGRIKQYFLEQAGTLSGTTLQTHFVILQSALKSAVRNGLLAKNPCALVDGRPTRTKTPQEDAQENCWTLDDTRTFLAVAKDAGSQLAALFHLAIDSGMRRGELCGLKWTDFDLDACKVRVDRTLLKSTGVVPIFGPPKTAKGKRTIDLNSETVRLLREHRRRQSELKMANRKHYTDHGLVFARDWDYRGRLLGQPLNASNLSNRAFRQLSTQATVRRITFHGLRHTSATLLLGAGEALHVVSARLGHANPSVTLNVYAHCLPSQQQAAAARLGALLASG